ncbi:hypothetical protein [Streptomyces sp. NPDC048516]|uniref:hypothetical protein n=1 Tax=Streptomyces sp. NPDC048516 TaxID=3365565 RepID=UPI003718CB3C
MAAGRGDLTGDKRPDIAARDTSGVLWLYQGTEDTTGPFTLSVQLGQGGAWLAGVRDGHAVAVGR